MLALALLGSAALVSHGPFVPSATSADLTPTDPNPLAAYYGFKPVEIFKLSERAESLMTADFNHDGLLDVIVIDNQQSRLDLLLQRRDKSEKPATVPLNGRDANPITDHWRFELKKLPVDQEVAAITLGDFNGDGRTDIAYYGLPDQLVIRYQPKSGEWNTKTQIRVPDVQAGQWCLAGGDLNGDGADDLVVLGKSETIVFYQQDQKIGESPLRLMNTSDKLGLAQVADIDADGRPDLCYLAGDGLAKVLCCRLQSERGQLGPEYVFDLERPRSVTLKNLDGKPGSEILTVDSRTGRVKVSNVAKKTLQADELPERLIRFGFGKRGSGKERDVAFGDLDGDGLQDLVVTDSEVSRMLVFHQRAGSGLDMGTPFPSFSGVDQIQIVHLDDDEKGELIVQSSAEKTLGISRYVDGRLTFPQAISLPVESISFDFLQLDGAGKPELLVVSKSREGKKSSYEIMAGRITAKGDWESVPLAGKSSLPIDLKATPERLIHADLNGDGAPELIFLEGTSKAPQVFSIDAKQGLTELTTAANSGIGGTSLAAVNLSVLKGHTGLLVAQENYARFLHLGQQPRWQVAEQFNATESNSRIAGAVTVELDRKPGPEIALADTGVKKLRLWREEAKGYQPWKEVDLGDLNFKGIRAVDINGDNQDDVVLIGADQLAVLYSSGTAPMIRELATFESQLENPFFGDVVAGDLNHDGFSDLAVLDVRNHLVEILQYREGREPRHALYFRVFEQKGVNSDEHDGIEPREAQIADVTGDGLPDLLLLSQDRLLVYPQDDGKDAK